ncbi:MAG: hypothetical protein ABIM99_00400 [Candidatus Dojkabacteria bacterium]
MNDAQTAINMHTADRVKSSREVTAVEFTYLYLPFENEYKIYQVFEDVIEGRRLLSELKDIKEIFRLIFQENSEGAFIEYYKSNTQTTEDPIYLYKRARALAIISLAMIMSDLQSMSLSAELLSFKEEVSYYYEN